MALVGASGSGKTTIANLVCGLISPTSGRISIGNVDYSELNISKLQEQLGYVTQESSVFKGDFVENVTFWDENPDHQRVEDILQQLELCGIGTEEEDADADSRAISGDGATLSGGERQRLGIAREIYRDPAIMIWDEATSALN